MILLTVANNNFVSSKLDIMHNNTESCITGHCLIILHKPEKVYKKCYNEKNQQFFINMELTAVKLIIGLGNPGKEYEDTFHNAGILAVNALRESNFKSVKNKNFEFAKWENFIFVKPMTFMNESGPSVKNALQYFKLKPENMLLAHDDSDIFIGSYKFSFGRGAAGHKGVQSVIDTLDTKNFWRLRIGIRPEGGELSSTSPRLRRVKAQDFVLQKIKPKDRDILNAVINRAIKEIQSLDL